MYLSRLKSSLSRPIAYSSSNFCWGMIVNLFATIPFDQIDVAGGSFIEKTGLAFGYARTSPTLSLQLHWLNACLLILASVTLLILR